jgi:hypothetical protein
MRLLTKRQNFKIHSTVILLVSLHGAAFLLGFTHFVFADAVIMFSNKPQVTQKLFKIFFRPITRYLNPTVHNCLVTLKIHRPVAVITQYSDQTVG